MWETVNGRITYSKLIEVKRAEKDFDPEVAERAPLGRKVENDLHEAIKEHNAPRCIENLRLPTYKRGRTMDTSLTNGVVVAARPDFTFLDSSSRPLTANMIELKLRGEKQEYDVIQAAMALFVAGREILFRNYHCEYYFFYHESQKLFRFDPYWVRNFHEQIMTMCTCAVAILAAQKKENEKEAKQLMGMENSMVQGELFKYNVKDMVKKSVDLRPEFLEIYKMLTFNWENRFLEIE